MDGGLGFSDQRVWPLTRARRTPFFADKNVGVTTEFSLANPSVVRFVVVRFCLGLSAARVGDASWKTSERKSGARPRAWSFRHLLARPEFNGDLRDSAVESKRRRIIPHRPIEIPPDLQALNRELKRQTGEFAPQHDLCVGG